MKRTDSVRSLEGAEGEELSRVLQSEAEFEAVFDYAKRYKQFSREQISDMVYEFCSLLRTGEETDRPTLSPSLTLDSGDLARFLAAFPFIVVHPSDLEAAIASQKDPSALTFDEVMDVIDKSQVRDASSFYDVFPFDPDSYAKQTWDLIVMAFLLYTTFSVPFSITFNVEPVPLSERATAYAVFDLSLDCLFCTDMLVSFGTAYTERGLFVRDLTRIAKHYLATWFLLDFFGSVPFDKIGAHLSVAFCFHAVYL